MPSPAQRPLVDPRVAALATAVTVAPGVVDRPRPSFDLHFIRTADVTEDPELRARIDSLAGAHRFTIGDDGNTITGRFEELTPYLDHHHALRLLAHESPQVRAMMGYYVASTWPDDAPAVYPLLHDPTLVGITSSCTGELDMVATLAFQVWCSHADARPVQDALLRAAADRALQPFTRDGALRCVAPYRHDDALRVALAWRRERDCVISETASALLRGERFPQRPPTQDTP